MKKKTDDKIHNAKLKSYAKDSVFAYEKLLLLAAEMNGDWIPNWKDDNWKYTVIAVGNDLKIDSYFVMRLNIAFRTQEAAQFSLEYHRELWEQYYMMK